MKTRKQLKHKKKYALKSALFFTILFLSNWTVFPQNKKTKDTSNIVFYPDKIMVRTNLSTQSDAQILKDKKEDNLDLETNNSYKLFFSVDYKFIGFSYGFYPHFIGGNNDEDVKGKSKFSEFNFRFFLGKWVQTIEYSKVRGYYVENTADFIPGWRPGIDTYLVIPDMKTITYGMSTSYIFNPKFSLKSITSFTEWQKTSAGSFIPTFVCDYKRISFSFDQINGAQNEYDLRVGGGYFYNFIIRKRFYVAPSFTTTIGVKFTNEKSMNSGVESNHKENYFTTNVAGGLKLGYNSNRILFGASFNFDSNSYKETKTQTMSNDKAFGLLYFGYRFDAPKFISKPINKIDEKLKF